MFQKCEKQYDTPGKLKEHILRHSDPQPFKCEQCDKGFTKKYGLKMHMLLHTDVRPQECKYCDKKYIQSGSLTAHVNSCHKDEVLRDLNIENENK